jgi:hypothetical protein
MEIHAPLQWVRPHPDSGPHRRHYKLKGDFMNYDHWVGQFAVYAVTVDSGF